MIKFEKELLISKKREIIQACKNHHICGTELKKLRRSQGDDFYEVLLQNLGWLVNDGIVECPTSIIIPNSVTSIGNCAFTHCTGLISIIIPNSVTSIGECAFTHCTGLTSITIPNSVTSIGNCAFTHCTGLTSITIPNNCKLGYKAIPDNCNNI